MHDDYWVFAKEMWENAVVVSKSESVREWDLLQSWVDLRYTKSDGSKKQRRNEYGV